MTTPPAPVRKIRWWPLLFILACSAAYLVWVQSRPEFSHQQRNLYRAGTFVVTGALSLLWLILLSRLKWQWRLSILGFTLFIGGSSALLFRIRGVSGDLFPVLESRFGHSATYGTQSTLPFRSNVVEKVELPSAAQDYPQFGGPNRNGLVTPLSLARDWTLSPPKLLWRHSVGAAWSGFATQGNRAVTQEQRGENETVVCYDLNTGAQLWIHEDLQRYFTVIAGEGPRATPAIHESKVYAMGATGTLCCLELLTGRLLWTRQVTRENEGHPLEWGASCSPLVHGDLVIVSSGAGNGSSLVAYSRLTGEPAWKAGNDRGSYSSPLVTTLAGMEQILMVNGKTVAGHDPKSGQLLWEHAWPSGNPHATAPLVWTNDLVLVSSGYGVGCEMFRVRKGSDNHWSTERQWKTKQLKSKFANLVPFQGYVYGLDDGILVCVDSQNGERRWKEGRYGHGQFILCGSLLLIMAENGRVVLFQPSPERAIELTSFLALSGKTWNPPALSGELLLVRNDLEAACYRLPLEK